MRGRHRLSNGRDAPADERRLIQVLRFTLAESVLRITASPALDMTAPVISAPGRNARVTKVICVMPTRPQKVRRSRPIAVLFDLDGTLIDSIGLILGSMRYAFAKCRAPLPTDAEWLTGVGTPLRTMFQRYSVDDAEIDRLIAAYREHQFANHDDLVRCYDDIPAVVASLAGSGHPMAVVTSKTESLARRGLDHVGLTQYFDAVIGCDTCARHKPHPQPVLTALERLGYQPDEAAFVGDSVHDVEAGNAAGVLTIAALWGPFTREQLAVASPGRYVERIVDLPQIVAEQ